MSSRSINTNCKLSLILIQHIITNQVEQAEVDDEGLGDVEDDTNGGLEDDAFFEEVAQIDAAELSLDSSAHNILQVLH